MRAGGVWEAGEWTDDTAMALCLSESILVTRNGRRLFDEDDLARRYGAWAASGPKDIGGTCAAALRGGVADAATARRRAYDLHQRTGKTAGNRTVMRCVPIAIAAADERQRCAPPAPTPP